MKCKISVSSRVALFGLALFYLLTTSLRIYTQYKPVSYADVSLKQVIAGALPAKKPLFLQEAADANTATFIINPEKEYLILPAIFSSKLFSFFSSPLSLSKPGCFLVSRLLFRIQELPNAP
ncbi:MAG: hypothetical protein ACO1OF_18715 [Adhaeribacter sp.]